MDPKDRASIMDSQVDAVVELSRRIQVTEEEKFEHEMKRYFSQQNSHVSGDDRSFKVGFRPSRNHTSFGYSGCPEIGPDLPDTHGKVLSVLQQHEMHPSIQSVNAKENGEWLQRGT